MLRVLRRSRDLVNKYYIYVYVAVFFEALHYAFTLYVNSTFLNQFFSDHVIDFLYTTGSALALIALVLLSRLFKKIGIINVLVIGVVLECLALLGLATGSSPWLLAVFFVFIQAIPPLLLFCLDIILEGSIHSETVTGKVRSLYLAVLNTAILISPFVAGALIFYGSYSLVYVAAAIFIIFFGLAITEKVSKIKLRPAQDIVFFKSLEHFLRHENLFRVFSLNFLLQSFYALMVIYMPIYLKTVMGFDWFSIGIIFTVMLVPFVIFEAPLGRIFDRFHCERDVLIAGFLIMAGACIAISLTYSHSLVVWATLLFISRIGASFVEVSSEYAFFKRVNERNAEFIGIFRTALPLSYIVAPVLASSITLLFPISSVFVLIAFGMVIGVTASYSLGVGPRLGFTRS